MSGIIGRKARAGGPFKSDVKAHGSAVEVVETGGLECRRGKRNSTCSGEMRRDVEEHQWQAAFWSVTDAEARKRGSKQD